MEKRKRQKRTRGPSKSKRRTDFIFKTLIDGLIAGLIAISIFLGRPPNQKPFESYIWIIGLITAILILIIIYSKGREKNGLNILGLFLVIAISIAEVIYIGIAFQETIESMFITMIIVLPSVIIFDKLLG